MKLGNQQYVSDHSIRVLDSRITVSQLWKMKVKSNVVTYILKLLYAAWHGSFINFSMLAALNKHCVGS